jgi:hypothetical protein
MTATASNAARIDIIMPTIVWPDFGGNPVEVRADAPKAYRTAVWRIAQYFAWEVHCDFALYGDGDPSQVAYLWCPSDCNFPGWRVHCIGAACFRKRQSGEVLQWIWIHPFFRRQGLLSAAWPRFQEAHGSFDVEPPLTKAMESFLRRQCAERRKHME